MVTASKLINCLTPLGFPYKTLDPFLFCVHHRDLYPAGDAKMQAPRRGNGADFSPSAPYRMYHGDRIPGFPQHPHRGFETVTATMEGLIDHTDSMGSAGRYGQGDLQWMTAGKGVVHGEMFPLVNDKGPNTCDFFQIWLNLPAKSKMVEPTYVMHWAERIPVLTSPDGKATIRLWAGELQGQAALAPPPNSWAADKNNEVAILKIDIAPGGTFELPAAAGGSAINRAAYFIEGGQLEVGGELLPGPTGVELNAALPAPFHNRHATETSKVLMLQGRPIGEPVANQGPFVMNTQAELMQAYKDYQRTQFGGWPWDEDAVVFPREKGRFSLMNGQEERPQA